eukprot:m.28837 g.28837  ORF g.28837 m.28837 type:complete len:53 (+) comp31068_c0_seq1:92-250(+)
MLVFSGSGHWLTPSTPINFLASLGEMLTVSFTVVAIAAMMTGLELSPGRSMI